MQHCVDKPRIMYKILDKRFINKYAYNWLKIRIKFEKEWLKVLNILKFPEFKMRIIWLDSKNNIKYSYYPPIPHEFLVLNRTFMSKCFVDKYANDMRILKDYCDKKINEINVGKIKNLITVVLIYHFERDILIEYLKYTTVIIKTHKKWEKERLEYKTVGEQFACLYEIASCVVDQREKNNRYKNN